MIQIGNKVKDLITGLEGVAIARTEWLYGCARIAVEQVKLKEDGKLYDAVWLDEQRLEKIESDSPVYVGSISLVDIDLGNKVEDQITKYVGVVVSKTMWLSGNVTLGVETTNLHDGKPIDPQAFDYRRLTVLERTKPPMSKSSVAVTGGPQNDPKVR